MQGLLRIVVGATLAAVSLAAQDDREQSAHVPTVFRTGQSITDLSIMRQTGLRLTDLEVESTSPLRLTVTAVSNSSSYGYQKTWWYYADVTTATLSSQLAANQARLIDLETWVDGSTTKHAAIMIANSGADATAWWWYVGATSLQVNSFVNSNSARLINLERYSTGGSTLYSCVMVANSGRNARATRHFYNVPLSTIDAWNAANNMRIYDIERVSQDRFDAIVVESQGQIWWHYYAISASRAQLLMNQHLGRVIDVERRPLFGGLVQYDIVMLDNARTDLERRTRARLDGTDGVTGAYLKTVGGGLSAYINETIIFEPAGTMMTLHLAHAIREIDDGRIGWLDRIRFFRDTVGDCPSGSGTTGSALLQDALPHMMDASDTRLARAIEQQFATPTIAQTATALGLQDTVINHQVGCAGPTPNGMTLIDLGQLLEQAMSGFYRSSRSELIFRGSMRNGHDFPSWGSVDLSHRIQIYSAALGLSETSIQRFRGETRLGYMSGSYSGGGRHYNSEGGYVEVPYLDSAGNPRPTTFVFGAFDHGGTNLTSSRNAVSDAAHELVWDKVREGLDTWSGISTLTIRSVNPSADVTISANPADRNGWQGGNTEFGLDYLNGTTVTLTAPAITSCNRFRRWVIDGTPRFVGLRQVSFQINGNHTAVAEYRQVQPGSVQHLGTGCPGRSGLVPQQTIRHPNGQCGPQQATPTTYAVADAVASTAGVLHIGSDTNSFGAIPLPWDLTSVGATGCVLHHDIIVSPPIQVDQTGQASIDLTWPVDPAARGIPFYSTFAILDFAANPLGLVHSNALRAAQGGGL